MTFVPWDLRYGYLFVSIGRRKGIKKRTKNRRNKRARIAIIHYDNAAKMKLKRAPDIIALEAFSLGGNPPHPPPYIGFD